MSFMDKSSGGGQTIGGPDLAGPAAAHLNQIQARLLMGALISRHCEERSDEAIQNRLSSMDCFATLAMTVSKPVFFFQAGYRPHRTPVPPQRWHFTTLSPFLSRPLPSQFLHFGFFLMLGPLSLAMIFSRQ
jgi:hypothetical protein